MAKAKTKATTTTKKVTKKPVSTPKKATTKKKVTTTSVAAQPPFFQIRVTDQTLYWLIFGAVSVVFAMWIYMLDAKVRDLYDQIDMNTYSTDAIYEAQMHKKISEQQAATPTETPVTE